MGFKQNVDRSLYYLGDRVNQRALKKHIRKLEKTGYKDQRGRLFYLLENTDPNSEEYSLLLKHLELLERNNATLANYSKVSADTKAYIASKAALCVGIVAYEQNNVITTKAAGVLSKWRDK